MKKTAQWTSLIVLTLTSIVVMLSGCSSSFWGGTAAGGVVGAGAYEVHANQEKKKLDEDLKAGRIDQKEYDARRDQLGRDSIFQ